MNNRKSPLNTGRVWCGIRPIYGNIKTVWDCQVFMMQQSSFYSNLLEVEQKCTQGDTDSPVIFNIIIDAVPRRYIQDAGYGLSQSFFYADDGLIQYIYIDPITFKWDLDAIINLFEKLFLHTNETNKCMVRRYHQHQQH